MRKLLKTVHKSEDVMITSNIDLTAEVSKYEVEKDVFEYEFLLSWDEEQAKAPDSKVVLVWSIPCVDVQYMWHPGCRARRVLDADWRLQIESMLTNSAPMALLFNADDRNISTFATDEVKKVSSVRFGVDDDSNTIAGDIEMGLRQFVGKNSHRLRVRADFQKIPYYEALDGVRRWWEKVLDLDPMAVPDVARHPMYSSWYNYHQEIQAEELEKECVLAKEMGMDAIIVDDGWQTDNNDGGYGYTGDWEVCAGKIPDMREHVKRVHELGMKYILWYSVPFVGDHSKNWERFQDKVLVKVDRNQAGVLDPRYPEVREFLIGIYEKALQYFDLDGLKLDFIDRFRMQKDDHIRPGMDCQCVQEATERLMTDIMKRLKNIKEDVMIEFRQSYIGPGMRRFGNLFRVADCPGDITTNRVGICDLRLLNGNGTAVHSDMITWNNEESVEDAALQVLNTIFGVTQFSKVIGQMRPEHREMVTFWLKFAGDNVKVLQQSEFIPYEPHFLYPVIKAFDAEEEIIGVYACNKVIRPDPGKRRSRIINATKEAVLYLKIAEDCEVKLVRKDCGGHVVSEEKTVLHQGVTPVEVPRSGLLEMSVEW
nr:glycoside hydrolase family 36 protein [uncultured Acetatifactor sp.]